MSKSIFTALAALALFASALSPHAEPLSERKTLTLEGAEKVMAAAIAEARRLNAPGGAIAIVDDGGHAVLTARLDNTFPAASTISLGKARTSALFRKPTKFFEDVVNKGRTTRTESINASALSWFFSAASSTTTRWRASNCCCTPIKPNTASPRAVKTLAAPRLTMTARMEGADTIAGLWNREVNSL